MGAGRLESLSVSRIMNVSWLTSHALQKQSKQYGRHQNTGLETSFNSTQESAGNVLAAQNAVKNTNTFRLRPLNAYVRRIRIAGKRMMSNVKEEPDKNNNLRPPQTRRRYPLRTGLRVRKVTASITEWLTRYT